MAFNYINLISNILSDKGLDHMLKDVSELSLPTFKRFTSMCYEEKFIRDIANRSSLVHFRTVKENTLTSSYLHSQAPFTAIQLKFKLRTGVSGIGEDLYRQERGLGRCKACGDFESLKHFILYCKQYAVPRQKMFSAIKISYGDEIFSRFLQNHDFAIICLLGDHDDDFNRHFLSYLQTAWSVRKNV
jgi:hypothetical protein